MYRPEDFNLTNAPKEMVQYVLDNVRGFEPRYQYALYIISEKRCSLEHAMEDLYFDIWDCLMEWFNEHKEQNPSDFDIEEIFG